MIELYLSKPHLRDREFNDLRSEARSAMSRGMQTEAAELLFAALRGHANQAREDDFARAAMMLHEAMIDLGRPAEAASLAWYAGDLGAQQALLPKLSPIDRARTLLRWSSSPSGGNPVRLAAEAGEQFEAGGQLVRAAIAYERASDWERARALWSRLASRLLGGPRTYEAALAHFNLFRSSQKVGDSRSARTAGVAAVHLLEEAADRYESSGQRDRAFDCFQTLIAIGNEMHVYEHVLEGYVNASRILCEDHLRTHAIETFQEAIESARSHGELVAAATIAHEMAAFARKENEPAIANQAVLFEADLWRQAAEQSLHRGSPVSVAEHALLAAVLAYGEIGQFRTVGEVYQRLSQLKLPAQRKEHFSRAIARYRQARNEPIETSSVQPRLRDSLPAFWHDDLCEWEEDGSASEICADILLSSDNELTRRNALLTRVIALAAAELPDDAQSQIFLCNALSVLSLYPVLSAFERLLAHHDPRVREEAIKELANFRFKRTFQSIRVALDDAAPQVVKHTASTVARMRFPHAIEPLSRLYREARDSEVRRSAIRALAEIDHGDAAETLLGVLSFGTQDDRHTAAEALKSSRKGKAFFQAARLAKSTLDAATRNLINTIFQQRGQPPL